MDTERARRQLQRVLASPGFVRNERMSRFLRFLSEHHLEGNDGQLKESVIAVEVFGRRPDHDPSQDSIVRTEAGRLRARLAEFYLGDGNNDPIIIELPKGGYTPAFRLQDVPPPPAPSEKKMRLRAWLVPLVAAVAIAAVGTVWAQRTERFWKNPIGGARFQTVADLDGTEQEAAVSRDGKFVAFLSDREGHTDVWVHTARFGPVPQPHTRKCSRTRQSLDPHLGIFTRWLTGNLLGSQTKRFEWAYQHLGGTDTRRRVQDLSGRRRGV